MRYILSALGLVFVALGVLGIFLPVLPTTPFLLLSSYLFLKSSPRLESWLLNHPILGRYIVNYRVHKAIPLKAKIYSITLLWVTILTSIIWFIPLLPVKFLLAGIAVGVTIHICRFKTLR